MNFFQKLKQPFPYENSFRNHLFVAGFFGTFIFLFLFIFKPFQLDTFENFRVAGIAAGYGLVSFVVILFFNQLFPLVLPRYFNANTWTTGKQIFLILVIIFFVGIANYLASPFLVGSDLDFSNALWAQGVTLTVAVLPVGIFYLVRQNRLLKKFSKEAEQIDQKLSEKLKKNEQHETLIEKSRKLVITGENQGEKLEIFPDDLHLVEAASNYIKVYHLTKERLEYSIIRSTLKKAGEIILAQPNFFKCHRTFIINLDKVTHVEGNAQGYKIKIEGYDEHVPVSRNLNAEFADKLLAYRQLSI